MNNRRKIGKFSNMWKINNIFLNNQWVNEEIISENGKYLEIKANEHITYQNLGDTAKTMLREKFIAILAYVKQIRALKSAT